MDGNRGMGLFLIVTDSYCGSFPHSLLSTSKISIRQNQKIQKVTPARRLAVDFAKLCAKFVDATDAILRLPDLRIASPSPTINWSFTHVATNQKKEDWNQAANSEQSGANVKGRSCFLSPPRQSRCPGGVFRRDMAWQAMTSHDHLGMNATSRNSSEFWKCRL